jgi:hypothetical protein
MENLELKAQVADTVVDILAGSCGAFVSSDIYQSLPDNPTSAVMAGIVRFCVKSFAIAGFTEEQLILAVKASFITVANDADVKNANILREARKAYGSEYESKMQ